MPSWKKVIISGSAAELSSLYAPSITGSLQGTSSFAVTASYALTASISNSTTLTQVLVLNQTGFTITTGMVVRITGSNNASDIPRITTASYESDSVSANTLGIASANITNGSQGYIVTEGVLTGINTTGWSSGTLLFLGATGSITGAAPQAPLHAVRLGQVIREQSNNGSIHVRVDNGYELNELHDVTDTTTTASYGDLLVKSGSVWINSKQLTGSYGLTGSLIISASGATNDLRVGTDKLFVSASGNVGIGTTTPNASANLEVYNSIDSSLHVNSGANSYVKLKRGIANADAHISFDTTTTQKHIVGLINNTDSLIVGGTESTPVITISGSNVGIGTTTPTSSLHVKLASPANHGQTAIMVEANAGVSVNMLSDNYNSGQALVTLGRLQSSMNGFLAYGVNATGSAASEYQSSQNAAAIRPTALEVGNGSIALKYNTTSSIRSVGTNIPMATSLYMVGSNGRIGIGTQTPQAILHVSSSGYNEQYPFLVGFNTFAISSSGNIGIGTTTPSVPLHVMGNTLITGSLTVGASSIGPYENTITLGARDNGSEGGQIGFNAPGGTYTSASMIDLYQNRLRILKGTNAGSTAEVAWWNMHNLQMALPAYTSATSFTGTAAGYLAFDSSGNIITTAGVGSAVNIGNSDLTITSDAFRVLSHAGNSRFTISGSTSNALLELNNTTTSNSRIISMREQLNGETNRNSVRNFTAAGNNADDSQHNRWMSDHIAEFVSGSAVAIDKLRGWKWSYYTEVDNGFGPTPIYKDILLISTSNEATLNASLGITGSITIGYGLNTNLDPYGFIYGTGSYLNGTSTYSAILGGESNRIHTQGTGNVILGGLSNSITGSGAGGGHSDSVIIGGSLNRIDAGAPANGEVIAASYSSSIRDGERVSIIASDESTITNGYNIALIGTYKSTTSGTPLNTAIIGGTYNRLGAVRRSVILGGSQITASADDTVYMPNAVITGSAYLTGTTEGSYGNIIVIDTGSGQLYYTASGAIGGGSSTPAFPYTGSARITGSLSVTGSIYGTELISTTNQYGDITNITPALMSVESNDGANAIIQKVAYTNTTGIDYTPVVTKYYPRDISYTARGSNSLSYNQLLTGHVLNAREHWGYDGIQYGIGFHEYTIAIGTWDNSSHPTAWRLQLTPSGSTTLVQRMEIDETGIITLTSDDIRFDTLPNQTADSIVYIESGSGRISYSSINSLSSGNAFPYTGSAQITGSLGITGSLSVGQSLNATATSTANIGSTTIYSVSTSSYDGAWFEYTARSGSDARAGQIMSIWSGSQVNFTETTTTDFGSTAGLSLGVFIVNGAMALTASAATNGWNIKTIVRSI